MLTVPTTSALAAVRSVATAARKYIAAVTVRVTCESGSKEETVQPSVARRRSPSPPRFPRLTPIEIKHPTLPSTFASTVASFIAASSLFKNGGIGKITNSFQAAPVLFRFFFPTSSNHLFNPSLSLPGPSLPLMGSRLLIFAVARVSWMILSSAISFLRADSSRCSSTVSLAVGSLSPLARSSS